MEVQRLFPIGKLMFPLTIALIAAISAVTVLAQAGIVRSTPLNDPFLAYADVFPGQLRSGAHALGFVCSDSGYLSPTHVVEYCTLRPENRLFSQVNITIRDSIITRLHFIIQEDALRIRDLMLLWGNPDRNRTDNYDWLEYRVTVFAPSDNRRFEYFVSVIYVTFTL